jgi:hypothetical protein
MRRGVLRPVAKRLAAGAIEKMANAVVGVAESRRA